MFRFYLDNTFVSDASNWFDFTETIERDEVIKALLPKYDIKLTFTGDAYAYLYSQYKANGFCKLVQLKVDEQCSENSGYETILNGYIFISDCVFNLNKCSVDCAVMDNNFGAKIFNNKSIKAYLNVGRSKNDTAITACAYDDIRMFIPTTGSYLSDTRRSYNLKDAFRFLIDFMTDGQVGFESSFLSTVALNYNVEGTRLMTGHEMRLHDQTTSPYISFEDLFREVDIKYPLGFTIVDRSGVPTIKIENEAYFKNTTSSITVANIQDLKQSFDSERLYSKVRFGSTYLDYDGFLYHYPQIRFFNFVDEEYHFQGDCNIDRTLDLTGFIISDTNVIESCIATEPDNDTYDDELFFVQIDSGTNDAIGFYDPITGTLPYYYNGKLTNNEIAERYNLQGNIASYLGNNDDTFRAENTSLQDLTADYVGSPIGSIPITNSANVISSTIAFQDDSTPPNFDTNGNYNNTLYKYVSPANGSYNFESNIKIIAAGTNTVIMQIAYKVYNSGGILQRTELSPQYNYCQLAALGGLNTLFDVFGAKNIYLPTGWYVATSLSAISTSSSVFYFFNVDEGSYFSCIQSENGGGVYQAEEPADYFVSKFEFDAPLSKSDYDLIKSDLSKGITINHDGYTNRLTWIRKTVRKIATGEMNWEQISSKNDSQ